MNLNDLEITSYDNLDYEDSVISYEKFLVRAKTAPPRPLDEIEEFRKS